MKPQPHEYRRGDDATPIVPSIEQRRVASFDTRTDGDTVTVEGYATTYDSPYEVYGGPPWGFVETIARDAAKKTVTEADVRFLINHDGLPLARSKSGTLVLESDKVGVLVRAELSAESRLAADLLDAMSRGDVDEMSIAFRVIRQEWNEDYTERTIRELALLDVSAVSYPANPATHIQIADPTDNDRAAHTGENRGMSLEMAKAILTAAR